MRQLEDVLLPVNDLERAVSNQDANVAGVEKAICIYKEAGNRTAEKV